MGRVTSSAAVRPISEKVSSDDVFFAPFGGQGCRVPSNGVILAL